MTIWDDLEDASDDDDVPRFYVEPPDGGKHLTELMRVVAFRKLLRAAAPKVLCFAIPNAGKRNPQQARQEGIRAGVFDYCVLWAPGGSAWVEFKGYDARGRPGKLSSAQIQFGNKLIACDHHAACFFDAATAVTWLRGCGAPVGDFR